jgi:hypothetical protein
MHPITSSKKKMREIQFYTNRWRNLQCSGGGDDRKRRRAAAETRRDEMGRDETASATKMKWELENGNLNLKEKIWFIYITKTTPLYL